MLSDYLAMRNEDPDFEPAYPVVAAGMRGVEGIEPDVYITDPTTGGFSYGLGPAAVGFSRTVQGELVRGYGRRWDICSWLPKDSRAGEYHRVDEFLSSDGDLCGLAVARPLLSRRDCRVAVCARSAPVGGLARRVSPTDAEDLST